MRLKVERFEMGLLPCSKFGVSFILECVSANLRINSHETTVECVVDDGSPALATLTFAFAHERSTLSESSTVQLLVVLDLISHMYGEITFFTYRTLEFSLGE